MLGRGGGVGGSQLGVITIFGRCRGGGGGGNQKNGVTGV